MREVDHRIFEILRDSPVDGIKVRDFIWVEEIGGASGWGFYSGADPITEVEVISARTGNLETREYRGAGTVIEVGDVVNEVGLDVFNLTVVLSSIDPFVRNMVYGGNIRNGLIEVHRGFIDPLTDELAGAPIVDFYGTVNKASPNRAAIGESNGIVVTCTSITNELTRSNPAMFSDATQSRRGGDRFCRYMEVMAEVSLPWGADPKANNTPRRKKFLGLF